MLLILLLGNAVEAVHHASATSSLASLEILDPCAFPGQTPDAHWLDRTERGVQYSVCRAALWFDGLFGKERVYEERDATFGWIQARLEWDEGEGVEPGVRLRAKFSLPRFERRVSAIFGRDGGETFDDDSAPGPVRELPASFRETDERWLIGLGYSPLRGAKRRFDLTGGVRFESIINPFLEGRYRRQWFLGERTLVRWRQSAFWEAEDGLGVGTRVDYEHILTPRRLLRWHNRAAVAQQLEGVLWASELTLFQSLGGEEAVAWQAVMRGESEAVVTVEHFGLRAIYRRPLRGDQLILELRPGVEWRREEGSERQAYLQMSVGFELRFGRSYLDAERGAS